MLEICMPAMYALTYALYSYIIALSSYTMIIQNTSIMCMAILTVASTSYCITQNFDGRNFYAFQPDCQNLTCQIFKGTQRLVKVTIRQDIFHQIFEKSKLILCYIQYFLY